MYISAGGCASKYSFPSGKLSCHIFCVSRPDGQNLIDKARVPQRRGVANPNALDIVTARLAARQYAGLLRFHCDDSDLRVIPLQDDRDASQRGSRTHRPYKRVDLAIGLLPDFFSKWEIAGDGIGIGELIHPESVGLPRKLVGGFDHVEE